MGKQNGSGRLVAAQGDKSAARMRRLMAELDKATEGPDDGAAISGSSMKYTWPLWPGVIVAAFVWAILSDSINGWGAFFLVAGSFVAGLVAWVLAGIGVTYLQMFYALVWMHRATRRKKARVIEIDDELWAQVASQLESRGSRESADDFVARHFAFFRDDLLHALGERRACLAGPKEARDTETANHLWAYVTRSLSATIDSEARAIQEAKDQRQATLRQRFPLPPTDTADAVHEVHDADTTSDASSIDLSK